MPGEIKIKADHGRSDRRDEARPLVLLYAEEGYRDLAEALSERLSRHERVLLCSIRSVGEESCSAAAREVLTVLKERSIKQVSLVGMGAAGIVGQSMLLEEPRVVRRAVLIDATTRPRRGAAARAVDGAERILPLGLPLRSYANGCDAKPFLHRARCPLLVVTTVRAGQHLCREAELLGAYAPTAWKLHLPPQDEPAELERLIVEFQQVQARCPQKNLEPALRQ